LDKHKDDYDMVEWYPDTELWGSAAWSWQSPALALAHFQFILKHGPKKPFHGSPEFHAALKAQKQKTESGWTIENFILKSPPGKNLPRFNKIPGRTPKSSWSEPIQAR
jgi:hypothetical protein